VRRDRVARRRDDGQQRLADAGADRDGPAGVRWWDAVAVALERDQRAARRLALDDDLGRERQRRQRPQRFGGAQLADRAVAAAAAVGCTGPGSPDTCW